MDAAFDPSDASWTGLSPKLVTMRRAILVVVTSLAGVLAAGLAAYTDLISPVVPVVAAAAALAVGWRWIGRNHRAWAYTEREDDLLVRRGVAFRQLVLVPYGRLQFVDITDGPLQRRFGLATVQLHTAAARTDARIPGLARSEAARLRDRLAVRGESRASGL